MTALYEQQASVFPFYSITLKNSLLWFGLFFLGVTQSTRFYHE